jgi:hypothetical protein
LPWSENYYPKSMTNLSPEIRLKAIEIANALLEEGYEEGTARFVSPLPRPRSGPRTATDLDESTYGRAVRRTTECEVMG